MASELALIHPGVLRQALPISDDMINHIAKARDESSRIIQNIEKRLLVIVGPCSIHDPVAAFEYAGLLKEAANRFVDELFIVMRVYFEKPRTTIGWKGLIRDPHLDQSYDINHGFKIARQLLIDINCMGLPTGTEFLDILTPSYLSDLICWSAIGARTSESQVHRELASGLPMPVGFKNTTDGNIKIAIDAVQTAAYPQHYLGINEKGAPVIFATEGNQNGHIILRGSNLRSNYSAKQVKHAALMLQEANLCPKLMIDCSHGNSMKHYLNQKRVVSAIAEQFKEGSNLISGVMLESNLLAGKQDLKEKKLLRYGQSITDGCLSWQETLPLLELLAGAVRRKNRIPQQVRDDSVVSCA